MYSNNYFLAAHVLHAQEHILQHQFCNEYAPLPKNASPRANPARTKSNSIVPKSRPFVCIAPSITTITIADARRVNTPSTNNAHARISATTSTQNHAFIDKNVSQILWNAPPINPAACSAIGIFEIP